MAMRANGLAAAAARLAGIERPRVAAYYRWSTADQADGSSPAAQRRAVGDEIARRGWDPARAYEDDGKSGTSMRGRDGLARLLADAARGEVDVVVVHRLDRLARSLRDATAILARLEEDHRIPLVSIAEAIDPTSPFAPVLRTLMLVLAEQFSANLSGEVRKGLAQMWADGRHVGSAPTGYAVLEPHTRRSRMVPGPDAALIRRAFELAGAGDLAMATIAARLNAEFGGLACPVARTGRRHGD